MSRLGVMSQNLSDDFILLDLLSSCQGRVTKCALACRLDHSSSAISGGFLYKVQNVEDTSAYAADFGLDDAMKSVDNLHGLVVFRDPT